MILYAVIADPIETAQHLGEFLYRLVQLLWLSIEAIQNTTKELDKITFTDTTMKDYLGYARYAMGTPLYTLFSSVILIAVGVTLWTYMLKGIGYLKNLLPW